MRLPPLPRLVCYALLVTLCGAVVVAASTSGAAFGAYNPAWDGTSDMRDIAETNSESTLTLDTAPYQTPTPNDTLAAILAPAEPYTDAERATIREFVTSGGTLLVADNFGPTADSPPYGNTVLASVGATARFDGALLRDEQQYYRSPALPIAANVSPHPYTEGVSELTLNYATAVEPTEADTIVSTSAVAYLDRNRSGTLDETEAVGRYSVVTVESVGNGSVVAVSDPSIFINSMISQDGNRAFATALFDSHDRVIIDYSAGGGTPPLAAVALLVQSMPLLQGALAGSGVICVWIVAVWPAFTTRVLRRSIQILPQRLTQLMGGTPDPTTVQTPGPTDAELLAYLKDKHPDWDESRLQQIVASINQETEPTPTNE